MRNIRPKECSESGFEPKFSATQKLSHLCSFLELKDTKRGYKVKKLILKKREIHVSSLIFFIKLVLLILVGAKQLNNINQIWKNCKKNFKKSAIIFHKNIFLIKKICSVYFESSLGSLQILCAYATVNKELYWTLVNALWVLFDINYTLQNNYQHYYD